MNWKDGEIDGIVTKTVEKHSDDRGWLAEMFRSDEVAEGTMPAMGYVSVTRPGVSRGPHAHREQTDMFGFVGPGNFRIKLWDNRPESSTYGNMMSFLAGEDNPLMLIVPPLVVHGYTNVSEAEAWVLNYPNKLFAGENKKEVVDEIRHEETGKPEFKMEEE